MNKIQIDNESAGIVLDRVEEVGLCDARAIEAIVQDSMKSYGKDELFHLSYRVSAAISDDVARVRRKTGLSESKICRGAVVHGASIIRNLYNDCANRLDELVGKVNDIEDMPYVRRLASQASIATLEHSTDYSILRNNRFADWSIAYLGEFGSKILVNNSDMIRSAFCFSFIRLDGSLNIGLYESEVKNFDRYMRDRVFIFEAINNRYEEHVNTKAKTCSL